MKRVDVVIPCYNYAHYLSGCVGTILTQRDVSVRVLIIDDCSPDDTAEIGQAIAASDPRVSYIRNETNLGLIGTANRGVIDWASAEFVLLISADDALLPGALARATQALEAVPEASFAFAPALVFSENADMEIDVPDREAFDMDVIKGQNFIREICQSGNGVPSPTVVVRTACQKAAGPYNSATKHASDMEMWIRLASQGSVIALDTPQAWYRWHAANMSVTFTDKPAMDAIERITAIREAIAACGGAAPELPSLLSALVQREAESACWKASVAFESGAFELGSGYLKAARKIHPGIIGTRLWWGAVRRRLMWGKIGRSVLSVCGVKPRIDASEADSILFPQTLVRGSEWRWWPRQKSS